MYLVETVLQINVLPPSKTSSARNRLHLVESLPKVPRGISKHHVIALVVGYSPQPDSKALLLNTALTYGIEHR